MLNFIKTFAHDEDGAVTVDWVVLTAAIVGLAIAVGTVIFGQTEAIATSIDAGLAGEVELDTEITQGAGS